ncbi:MAG: hypothetical protein HY270_19205, partial [Deltaproteobacteria bacterium]|nr:hypothetical protein [Deltaproteobacteria bacterium]
MTPAAKGKSKPPVDFAATSSVITALVLLLGIVCLFNGARRVGKAFPGFFTAQNLIIVSIGRHGWAPQDAERLPFAKLVAINGRPVTNAVALDAHARSVPPGTPVTYWALRGADLIEATVPTQIFTAADFLAVYGIYFFTGLCFTLAGWWALRNGEGSAVTAFFITCETASVLLFSGGDVYGPYWFTSLYFTAHAVMPAAVLHLASSYPEPIAPGSRERRIGLALIYGAVGLCAVALNRVQFHPSIFLPFIYSVYLLLANALLLYATRLGAAWWASKAAAERRRLRLPLIGLLLSSTLPGIIFVIYPSMSGPISPALVVLPLAIFPLLTVRALPLHSTPATTTPRTALRLSLLFLGAVETTFLGGILFFLLNSGEQNIIDQVAVNERLFAAARAFLVQPVADDSLATLEGLAQSP